MDHVSAIAWMCGHLRLRTPVHRACLLIFRTRRARGGVLTRFCRLSVAIEHHGDALPRDLRRDQGRGTRRRPPARHRPGGQQALQVHQRGPTRDCAVCAAHRNHLLICSGCAGRFLGGGGKHSVNGCINSSQLYGDWLKFVALAYERFKVKNHFLCCSMWSNNQVKFWSAKTFLQGAQKLFSGSHAQKLFVRSQLYQPFLLCVWTCFHSEVPPSRPPSVGRSGANSGCSKRLSQRVLQACCWVFVVTGTRIIVPSSASHASSLSQSKQLDIH
jgi:hypothetical protein